MKKIIATVLLLSIIILVGCNSLSREHYNQIKIGMDYQKVVTILGTPDKCDAAPGAKNCVWGNNNKNITIKFIGNKVVFPTMKGL